ncbi:hypothetical protein AArcSl_2672 [Halalkaliarchaeum desulfuricum]|uniref:DUF8006 domain-containing protein n=1 Tax=Halalkaliarchaeum desulfuricum TaxID=2055893 RepID=A0A343TMG8_9EURY|nr:hypothetical protein [Halalkaliarchaeum desulfuricum]AUX10290.1 hypothetical protein AArcSl_2672 [Halalkaliarchaeum desulfuricum]
MIPLQFVDSILLEYHIGQILLLVFGLAILGSLPLGSRKVLALNVTAFGLIFALTPQSLVPLWYMFFGLILLLVGPVLWYTAED